MGGLFSGALAVGFREAGPFPIKVATRMITRWWCYKDFMFNVYLPIVEEMIQFDL